MKRKPHSTEQIISILKEHEAGLPVGEILRKHSVIPPKKRRADK